MRYFLYTAEVQGDHIFFKPNVVFGNKAELIDFLKFFQREQPVFDEHYKKMVYGNVFLDYANITGKDLFLWKENDPASKGIYVLRKFQFFDQNGSIIDPRMFLLEILKNNSYMDLPWPRTYRQWQQIIHPKNKTQSRHHHKAALQRHARYKHILRDKYDTENRPYIRRKPVNRLDVYSGFIRRTSGCWKDQSKKKRQWERRTNNGKNFE